MTDISFQKVPLELILPQRPRSVFLKVLLLSQKSQEDPVTIPYLLFLIFLKLHVDPMIEMMNIYLFIYN